MTKKEITKKVFFVLEVAFIYGLISNLAHPVTPSYLNQLNLPSENFGYFFAAMNLGVLIGAPLWGAIGDVKNRKYMISIGLFIYAISQYLFGIFDTSLLIILARLLAGLGNSVLVVSMLSYVSNSEVLKDKKKEMISSFIVLNVLGASVGSAIGGIIGNYFVGRYQYVMFIQAIAIALYGLFLIFFHSTTDEIKGSVRSKNPFKSLADIKKINSFYLIYLIVLFLIAMNFTNTTKYLDVYFTNNGYSTMVIGLFSLAVGIITLLTNLLILPRITKKYNNYNTAILISFLGAVTCFLAFNIPNMIGIFSIYFLYIISKTILEPITVMILGENKEMSTSVLMGIRQSFISLGGIVGIIVAGYIYDFNEILLFNICASLLLISAIILFSIKNMKGR